MILNDLLTVGGATVAVLIFVQLFKQYLPATYIAAIATILVGPLLVLAAALALGQTSPEALGNALLTGFLAGAGAVGLYNVQKPLGLMPPKADGG